MKTKILGKDVSLRKSGESTWTGKIGDIAFSVWARYHGDKPPTWYATLLGKRGHYTHAVAGASRERAVANAFRAARRGALSRNKSTLKDIEQMHKDFEKKAAKLRLRSNVYLADAKAIARITTGKS